MSDPLKAYNENIINKIYSNQFYNEYIFKYL